MGVSHPLIAALATLLARRWAPTVAVSDADGLFVELTGVAHLHGGEARFCRRLLRLLARYGIAARVAVADTPGAAWALAGKLQAGGNVGMLVDQKFAKGQPTTFFGRPCRTNPLLPKLARQFDCDVYPARAVRLPGGRYRLILEPKLDLPRTADGEIDIQASCQALNDVVERWVRDTPEQWMWFHRRWQIT